MRYAAYFVAILAAAGLVFVISQPADQTAAPTPAASEAARSETPAVAGEAQLVTLNVPDMHCPFACYPAVKKTLEEQPGVLAVDLAKQKEEGVIDNPQVKVQVASTFDVDAAIDSLSQAGFEKSLVVQ